MQRIDEGGFVDVNGMPQWLTMRGSDRTQPALLLLGGPGASFAALAPFFAAWERDFTLVHWDQPGAGFTFARTPVEPESIERLVDDGLEVAEHACARLGRRKIALLSVSAGTIVGLQMTKRRPDLVAAYVGSGQVVDWPRQDALSYERLLARARARGDTAMLDELRAIGAPPYADTATDAVKSKYAGAPTPAEAAALAELMPLVDAARRGAPAGAAYLAPDLSWPEPFARSFAVYTALRREIVAFDARRLGLEFAVPLFFLQGAEDDFTVTAEVEAYAADVDAPRVDFVAIDGAGHSAFLLREEIAALLATRVREATADSEVARASRSD